jgi:hypothetical protein
MSPEKFWRRWMLLLSSRIESVGATSSVIDLPVSVRTKICIDSLRRSRPFDYGVEKMAKLARPAVASTIWGSPPESPTTVPRLHTEGRAAKTPPRRFERCSG